MTVPKDILEKALALEPLKKVELVDELLTSLDIPDSMIDRDWAAEAENRIEAFENGQIKALGIEEVLEKYR